MGNKRPSIRTLPDGYKVRHLPPDEAHPDGKMMMLGGQSPLTQRLDDAAPANLAAQQVLDKAMQARITVKQALQRAKGLPPEKSHV
jgi:hypothetical protein